MRQLNLRQFIPHIQLPVLMLAGAADGLLPTNIKDFELMPTATLHVISHAGHDVAR